MKTILIVAALSCLVIACSGGTAGTGTTGDTEEGATRDAPASSSSQTDGGDSGSAPSTSNEPRQCGDNALYNRNRTAACRACLERTCCDQLTACAKDEQCTSFMHCWDDLRCTNQDTRGCNQCVRAVMEAPEGYVGRPVNRLWDCQDKCWAQCT